MVKSANYKSLDSLDPVIKVLTEAGKALKDERRTIKDSPMSEILAASLGGVAVASIAVAKKIFAMVWNYRRRTKFVMVWNYRRRTKLNQEKEALYKEALKKHNDIINKLYKDALQDKERIEYLHSLIIILEKIIQKLEADLKCAA